MASYKSKRGARSKSRARRKKRDAFDADVSALEAETAAARRSAKLNEPGEAQAAISRMRSQSPAVKARRKSELEGLGFGSAYPDMYAFGGPVGGSKAKGRDGVASSGLTKGPSRAY